MTQRLPVVSGVPRVLAATVLGAGAALAVLALTDRWPGWSIAAALLIGVSLLAAAGVHGWTAGPRRRAAARRAEWARPPRPASPVPAPAARPPAPSGSGARPGASPHPATADRAQEPRGPAPAVEADPAPAPVAVAVPGGQWWDGPAVVDRAPDRSPADAPAPTTVAPLSSYGTCARLVQCPCCGGFRIGLALRPPVFDLGCLDCGHRWTWQPGTPWPRTVLRPRRNDLRTDDEGW